MFINYLVTGADEAFLFFFFFFFSFSFADYHYLPGCLGHLLVRNHENSPKREGAPTL